jgi:hypothetical protein
VDDHIWFLKLYDSNGNNIVKLHCEECEKDFGGQVVTIVIALFTTSLQISRNLMLCQLSTFERGLDKRAFCKRSIFNLLLGRIIPLSSQLKITRLLLWQE